MRGSRQLYDNKEYTVRLYFDLKGVTKEAIDEKIVAGRPVVMYGFVRVADDGGYCIADCSFNDYGNGCFSDDNEIYTLDMGLDYNPSQYNMLSIVASDYEDRKNINVLYNTYGLYAGKDGISITGDAYDAIDNLLDGHDTYFLGAFTEYSLEHMFDDDTYSGREYYYNNGNPNQFEDTLYDGFNDIYESIYGVDPSSILGY